MTISTTAFPRLTGSRARCAACNLSFSSTSSFDRHRVGRYSHDPKTRRCLSTDEMLAAGFELSPKGFWERASKRPKPLAKPVPAELAA